VLLAELLWTLVASLVTDERLSCAFSEVFSCAFSTDGILFLPSITSSELLGVKDSDDFSNKRSAAIAIIAIPSPPNHQNNPFLRLGC
jgi:hypothetical protein